MFYIFIFSNTYSFLENKYFTYIYFDQRLFYEMTAYIQNDNNMAASCKIKTIVFRK